VWLTTLVVKPFGIGLWLPASFLSKIFVSLSERKCFAMCKTRGISDYTASTGMFCVHLCTHIHILLIYSFLGAFAKLWKAAISFVMSVRLSARMEQLGSHWTDFHEIWYFIIFRKYVEKIQVSLKADNNKRYFTWRPMYFFIISRSFLLRMRNVSGKKCREIQNTHFVFSNFFPRKMCRLTLILLTCRIWWAPNNASKLHRI